MRRLTMSLKWIKLLFIVGVIYETLLGAAFLFFGAEVFQRAGVTPPNHMGYIQFPALLLILFGVMFLCIAGGPHRRYDWIPFGMGLKASYCGLVFWYQLHGGIQIGRASCRERV